MSRLPIINDGKLIRILKAEGFAETRQKGSHLALHKLTPEGIKLVVVPRNGDLPIGTVKSILRKAGITRERFFELLEII